MSFQVEHAIFTGVTRSGKTVGCLAANIPRMCDRRGPAYVYVDPPGSAVETAAQWCLRRGFKNFMLDRLRETDKTPGYPFFVPSRNPDPEQREAEQRELVQEAIASLVRSRGQLNVEANPITKEGLEFAFSLLIYQDQDVPFYFLRNCFDPQSEEHKYLLAHCTNPEVWQKGVYYGSLSPKDREYKCGPAERILRAVCDSPQFRRRCQPTFDLVAFLNAGGKLFIDGSSKGNLSRPDAAFLMGMILITVIRLARSGQLKRRVVLIVDEAKTADLLGDGNLIRSMAEAGKWGIEVQVILQHPFLKDELLTEELYGNANTLFAFKTTDPKGARFLAEKIGILGLDSLKVNRTIVRRRQLHEGFDIETVVNTGEWESEDGKAGKSKSQNIVARPRYENIEDVTEELQTTEDQLKFKQKEIMSMGVGECHILHGSDVTLQPTKVKMLGEAFPGRRSRTETRGQAKLNAFLQELKQTPAYSSQLVSLPTSPPTSQSSAPPPSLTGDAASKLDAGEL